MNRSWLWLGLLFVWMVVTLVIASSPTKFLDMFVALGVGMLLALTWCVRLFLAVRRGEPKQLLSVEPLIGLSVLGLCLMRVPESVRFTLSEPALTAYAKEQLAHPTGSETPRRIGLYRFAFVTVDKQEVYLRLGPGFLDAIGFSYATKRPHDVGEVRYTPLRGNWYTRIDSW